MSRLRNDPGSRAFVSSVGGSFNKHAFGVYSTEPPEAGFQYQNLDAEAASFPQRELCSDFDGPASIETYALRYQDGEPSLATFACRLEDGRRTWAKSTDPEVFAEMVERETCGRAVTVRNQTVIDLT